MRVKQGRMLLAILISTFALPGLAGATPNSLPSQPFFRPNQELERQMMIDTLKRDVGQFGSAELQEFLEKRFQPVVPDTTPGMLRTFGPRKEGADIKLLVLVAGDPDGLTELIGKIAPGKYVGGDMKLVKLSSEFQGSSVWFDGLLRTQIIYEAQLDCTDTSLPTLAPDRGAKIHYKSTLWALDILGRQPGFAKSLKALTDVWCIAERKAQKLPAGEYFPLSRPRYDPTWDQIFAGKAAESLDDPERLLRAVYMGLAAIFDDIDHNSKAKPEEKEALKERAFRKITHL